MRTTPDPPVAIVREPERMLRFAATAPRELAAMLDAPDAGLPAATAGAQPAAGCRLGIVDPTPKRLAVARKLVARVIGGERGLVSWRRNDIWFTRRPLLAAPRGGVAFVFPGLEADFVPRVDDVAGHFGLPKPDLSAANLGRHGVSVLRVGRLLDSALRRIRIRPDALAGHSVGEWTAMVAAGMHTAADLDALLDRFEPESFEVPGVEFAVLGCGADRVAEALTDRPDVVVSHQNSPRQTIVCGPPAAIADLVRTFRAGNVLCRVLPFRSGFHTPMLAPYLDQFRAGAGRLDIHPAEIPVWSATTARPFPAEADRVRDLYFRHLVEPVRFQALIEAMHAAGMRVFVQAGPGQLGSLVDDTLGDREHLTIAANSPYRDGLAQLRRVATALWVEGGDPDFAALSAEPSPSLGAREIVVQDGKHSRSGPSPEPVAPLVASGEPARPAAPVTDPHRAAQPIALAGLDELATRIPIAAEFSSFLRDTADSVAAVLHAAVRPAPAPVRPQWTRCPGPANRTWSVSTQTMPYLLDHCFARQRPGWPDESDRRPVVPATTVISELCTAAEHAAPGFRAVGVHDVRLRRWLVAAPGVDVPVTVTPVGPHRVEVRLGDYASGTVSLAVRYPDQRPVPWPPGRAERPSTQTPAQFYNLGWMFHGPAYRGISELTSIGPDSMRGVITVPAAPGGLLDNVGQLFGHWILQTVGTRRIVFPVAIRDIRFYGAEPPAGSRVRCAITVRSIDDTGHEFDAQVVEQGRVWAEITGWTGNRFDSDPETEAAYLFPERNLLSRRRPGGWFLAADSWTGLASRELYLGKYLNAAERADYARQSPRRQRNWLLGRIAVKDAVRNFLWQQGSGPLFPAEIGVRNRPSGAPEVVGVHGLQLPELGVSLAHSRETAVAIVRPRTGSGPGPGIDIEAVADRTAATHRVALSEPETRLLADLVRDSGEPESLWFTRFWTAKEAVGKAVGTGLGGDPKRFVVHRIDADGAVVAADPGPRETTNPRRHLVRFERVRGPARSPGRDYVVAWTEDTATTTDYEEA